MKKDRTIEIDRSVTDEGDRYEFRDQGVEYTLVVNKQGSINLHTKAHTDNYPLRGVRLLSKELLAKRYPPFFYASYEIKSYYEELYGIPVADLIERITVEFSSEDVSESDLRNIVRDIDARPPDKAYFGI